MRQLCSIETTAEQQVINPDGNERSHISSLHPSKNAQHESNCDCARVSSTHPVSAEKEKILCLDSNKSGACARCAAARKQKRSKSRARQEERRKKRGDVTRTQAQENPDRRQYYERLMGIESEDLKNEKRRTDERNLARKERDSRKKTTHDKHTHNELKPTQCHKRESKEIKDQPPVDDGIPHVTSGDKYRQHLRHSGRERLRTMKHVSAWIRQQHNLCKEFERHVTGCDDAEDDVTAKHVKTLEKVQRVQHDHHYHYHIYHHLEK